MSGQTQTVVASVHIADLSMPSALAFLARKPKPGSIDGLRQAEVGVASPMRTTHVPRPSLHRAALIAFWDDDSALDAFLREHRIAAKLASGWHARLEPLRVFGAWPGVPEDLPKQRAHDYRGEAIVLTLGRMRLLQAPRFLRTAGRAEARAIGSPGLIWATAIARPPFVATCSHWESIEALSAYAYGPDDPAHPDAIATDRAKPFHHRSAFIRFRPYATAGKLEGKNPLAERVL